MAHLLLIHCSDEPGLIYKITGLLFNHHLNIIRNSEFVEHHDNRFFMRTEFAGDCDYEILRAELLAALPPGSVSFAADAVLQKPCDFHDLFEMIRARCKPSGATAPLSAHRR